MDKDKLTYKLKEFYTLESFQVDFYNSQVNSTDNLHIKRAYERFANREQKHVDFFKNRLLNLGNHQPVIIGPVFEVAGFAMGKAVGLLSIKEQFNLAIALENKATQMYAEFINEASVDLDLEDLARNLWYFMVDEECHAFWFKDLLPKYAQDG
ncbi:MAG: demethoxyubiquinone hydroxylase family protein [Bacillota bacterium]